MELFALAIDPISEDLGIEIGFGSVEVWGAALVAFSGIFCAPENDLTSGVESLTSPLLDSTFLSEEAVLGLFWFVLGLFIGDASCLKLKHRGY